MVAVSAAKRRHIHSLGREPQDFREMKMKRAAKRRHPTGCRRPQPGNSVRVRISVRHQRQPSASALVAHDCRQPLPSPLPCNCRSIRDFSRGNPGGALKGVIPSEAPFGRRRGIHSTRFARSGQAWVGTDLDAPPKTAPQIPRRTRSVLARNDRQAKPRPSDCSYFLGVSQGISGGC